MRTRSKSKKKKKEKNEGKSYRAKSVGSVRGRNKISSYQFENSLSKSKTSDNWITLKIFSLGKYVFSVFLVLCQHLYSFLYFLFICVVGRERHDLSAVQNGYELVIKAIKEVEFILDTNCDDSILKKQETITKRKNITVCEAYMQNFTLLESTTSLCRVKLSRKSCT